MDQAVHGPDPFTPEEFATEYQVPLEAVREALDYVSQNRTLIEEERDREAARLRVGASSDQLRHEIPDRRKPQ